VVGLIAGLVVGVVALGSAVSRAAWPARADPAALSEGAWTQADLPTGRHFWTPEELFDAHSDWAPASAVSRCEAYPGAKPVDWKPLLSTSTRGITVVAFAAGRQRVFCELTATTVTVSPPVDPAETVRVSLFSGLGTVAGVVPDGTSSVRVAAGSRPMASDAAVVRNGIFVRPNSFPARTTTVHVEAGASAVVAVKVRASTERTVVDRRPKGRPTSPDLSDCLGATDVPVADPGRWQPGASAGLDGARVRLWRHGSLLAVCRPDESGAPSLHVVGDGQAGVTAEPELASAKDVGATETMFYHFTSQAGGGQSSDTVAVAGVVLLPDAAAVELTRPRSDRVSAPVVGGTFLLTGIRLNETGTRPSILTVRDSAGRVLTTLRLADL